MNNKLSKNVLGYTRVSTQEQTYGYSLSEQKEKIEKYCEYKEYNLLQIYTDAGISGTSINEREYFKSLLRHIERENSGKKHGIDAVLIYKLSRISRRMTDLVNILDFFEKHKVHLISIEDNVDTSSKTGKMFIYFSGIFAEMERDNIVAQAKGGMYGHAKDGKFNGGTPPIGYNYSKETGLLTINEEEANTVKKIFELYTNESFGYSKLCQYLNRKLDTYKTKKGNEWSYSTLKQVLDNPIYVGKIRWGVHSNWNNERRSGKTTDYILADGEHEPIISNELWEKTRIRRDAATKQPVNIHKLKYLLSGLLKCPSCGASMVSYRTQRNTKNGKKMHRYYACSQWANKKTVCKPNLVNAEYAEKMILDKIIEFANQPDVYLTILNNISKHTNTDNLESDIKALEIKLKKLKLKEDGYYENLQDRDLLKVLKRDKLVDMIERINTDIEQVSLQLEELYQQKGNLGNEEIDARRIAFLLKNFSKLFFVASDEQQIELVHTVVKEVTIVQEGKSRVPHNITLHFYNLDKNITKPEISDNEPIVYEATYDTVHP